MHNWDTGYASIFSYKLVHDSTTVNQKWPEEYPPHPPHDLSDVPVMHALQFKC